MTHLIVAHFQSTNSAAQTCAAQILQAQTGGLLLKLSSLDTQGEQGYATVLEDHYCTMMTSRRGGIIDISLEERTAMLEFIQTRRAVLTEMRTIIVSAAPDSASQETAIETLAAICAAGVAPSSIRILATDSPPDVPLEEAYRKLADYASEAGIAMSVNAALPVSTSFTKAQQFKMPIAAVLNRAVDFETELTAARMNGAPEKIMHALAHKVIAQRDLLDYADAFNRLTDALGLPGISQDDWREEFAPVQGRKRAKTGVPD